MPLSLKDGVYGVRVEIGELTPYNWTDNQIITDLNDCAREMSSIAGALTKHAPVILHSQEAPLDVDVDEVKAVKYFVSGNEHPLERIDWKLAQIGPATSSNPPLQYYLKTQTLDLTPQSLTTSGIVQTAIAQPGPPVFRTIIGTWPIPPLPATLDVFYSCLHPWMQDPLDPCEIPHQFKRYWIAGAIARCLRIEKAHDEAQLYEQRFADGCEKYRIYAARMRNADRPARYGQPVAPWRRNPSSSIIFVDPNPQG